MRTVRHLSVGVVVALLGAALVGCQQPPEQASSSGGESDVTIAVGGQAAMVYLPTTLADELGYYEDEGLNVSIEDFEGGSEALESLLAGSADVVSGFYDHTIQMAAEGKQIQSFVLMLRDPGLVLAVAPGSEGEISSIEDLEGKTVGVTAPGSSTDMFLKFLLSDHGLDPEAASVAEVGATTTAVAAMERGRVDAAVMVEPSLTALEQRAGDLSILADTRTPEGVQEVFGVDQYPAAVFYSTTDWIDGNRETAQKLATAITRALDYMQSHSAQEIMEAMPDAFVVNEKVYLEGLQNSLPMYSSDGVMQAEGPKEVYEVLSLSLEEVANADIELSKTYTNEFVQD